jgi:Tol biopolymer transport system component
MAIARFFFTSQGRTAMMGSDGSGLRYFDFAIAKQETWQPCGFFSDGRRVLFLSMEARRDGPGRPFGEYYHKTPTHIWIYDLENDSLTEIATYQRRAPFATPQLLVGDERMLLQVVTDEGGQIYSINLDGSDAREFTRLGEGLPYGFNLSPAGQRIAYHLASPQGYQIWTSDLDGAARTLVSAHADYLYFGPQFSPDGEWLAFMGCRYGEDPGHDWADLCIARPDGSELRVLTEGQALWFAATYGPRERHGGGSNMIAWTRDGALLVPQRSPDAQVPWVYQAQRPDVDHFNRDFQPEAAHGGAQIRRIDIATATSEALTPSKEGVWDFRQSASPDGSQLLFCRAITGGSPAVWIADADGQNARELTKGLDEMGADHPRFLPQ